MEKKHKVTENEKLENVALSATNAFGSIWSILVHTIIFVGAFLFIISGANLNKVLLVLTTLVSLEAIYLSIFIKMSANRQANTLERVEKDMEEMVSDVEDMKQNVDKIEGEIKEIQKHVNEMEEDHIQEDLKKNLKEE